MSEAVFYKPRYLDQINALDEKLKEALVAEDFTKAGEISKVIANLQMAEQARRVGAKAVEELGTATSNLSYFFSSRGHANYVGSEMLKSFQYAMQDVPSRVQKAVYGALTEKLTGLAEAVASVVGKKS